MTTLDENVRAAADSGDLIGAIKMLRASSSMDLKDAKDAIDAYLRTRQGLPGVNDGRIPTIAIAALQEGDLIGAMRQTRMASGLGLKESKEIVERHLADNPACREQFRAAASRRRRWSWPAVLLTLLLLLAVAAAVLLRDKSS